MNKLLVITVSAIILLPLLINFCGRMYLNKKIGEEIKSLRAATIDVSSNIYNEEQLSGLPRPVQNYFRFALSDGQHYVSTVYLEHDGQFKTELDKEWIDIKGEQYFSAREPGFLWNGKTSLFSVRDMYISGEGRIKVTLLNLLKIVDGKGVEYDQGELLRWLGESVWFPTNLLPGPRLHWSAIDDKTALLTFKYGGQEVAYKVSFSPGGAITQLETERHMGQDGLQTWIGRVSDYSEVNGMQIPMRIEAIWKLDNIEHSYARFNVKRIHHDDLIEGER